MDIQVTLAIQGNLEAWRTKTTTAYLQALKAAVQDEARAFQLKIREDTSRVLGERVSNAWRLDTYPKGVRLAYEPSAFLHSRAAKIIENFSKGEPYGPRHGQALAIPIPGSPADDVKLRRGQRRVDAMAAKFGPLKEIQLKSGIAMLVGFGKGGEAGAIRPLTIRTHKGGGKFSPLGQALVTIPLFWLVRNARLGKRLHWQEIAAAEKPQFAGRVAARLRQAFPDGRAAASTTPSGSLE